MRVISGVHKSKPLESMEGRNTRPTGQSQEGIFNGYMKYQRLDVICSSGALGIEALSQRYGKVIL